MFLSLTFSGVLYKVADHSSKVEVPQIQVCWCQRLIKALTSSSFWWLTLKHSDYMLKFSHLVWTTEKFVHVTMKYSPGPGRSMKTLKIFQTLQSLHRTSTGLLISDSWTHLCVCVCVCVWEEKDPQFIQPINKTSVFGSAVVRTTDGIISVVVSVH